MWFIVCLSESYVFGRRLMCVSHRTPELSTRLPRSLKGNLLCSGPPLILVYFSLYFSSYPKLMQKYVGFFLFCSTTKLSGCSLNPVLNDPHLHICLSWNGFWLFWFKLISLLFSRSLQGRIQGSPQVNLCKAICGLLEFIQFLQFIIVKCRHWKWNCMWAYYLSISSETECLCL